MTTKIHADETKASTFIELDDKIDDKLDDKIDDKIANKAVNKTNVELQDVQQQIEIGELSDEQPSTSKVYENQGQGDSRGRNVIHFNSFINAVGIDFVWLSQ